MMEGENDEEVMRKAREHGQSAHGMKELAPDMERNLRAHIKNV
jgi:predicted small metal-binding protein